MTAHHSILETIFLHPLNSIAKSARAPTIEFWDPSPHNVHSIPCLNRLFKSALPSSYRAISSFDECECDDSFARGVRSALCSSGTVSSTRAWWLSDTRTSIVAKSVHFGPCVGTPPMGSNGCLLSFAPIPPDKTDSTIGLDWYTG